MSNGHVCCLLGVCCPPDTDGQRLAAVEETVEQCGPNATPETVINWVMSEFDLVPKGVGEMIVNAYDPEFKKKYANRLPPQ